VIPAIVYSPAAPAAYFIGQNPQFAEICGDDPARDEADPAD
jgi:hypothetical protein